MRIKTINFTTNTATVQLTQSEVNSLVLSTKDSTTEQGKTLNNLFSNISKSLKNKGENENGKQE